MGRTEGPGRDSSIALPGPGTARNPTRYVGPEFLDPVKMSSQKAGPRPGSRPLPCAGSKHWRGEESRETGCTQTAPGTRLPDCGAPSPLPAPTSGNNGWMEGVAQILELGRGFWELFLQPVRRWREPDQSSPKASRGVAWGEPRTRSSFSLPLQARCETQYCACVSVQTPLQRVKAPQIEMLGCRPLSPANFTGV